MTKFFFNKFLLILFMTSILFAQSEEKKSVHHNFLRLGYQAGSVLQTSEFLQGENATGKAIDYFQSLRVEFGWQTDGNKTWHQVFNFPSYGIGLYGANFFNTSELGTPSAIYGFFNWPFARYEKSFFSAEFGFGLAYDWEEFDPESNPYNLVIGAGKSVYIDVGVKYTYEISNHWNVSGQLSFSHFSNGSSTQPNAGVNLVAPRINVAYHFDNERPKFVVQELPEFKPNYELNLSLTYGSKSDVFKVINPKDPGDKYDSLKRESFDVYTLIATVNKQIAYKSKIGLGADIEIDNSLGVQYENVNGEKKKIDSSTSDKIRAGIFAQYSLVVYKLEGMVGVGYYIYGENPGTFPKVYQRLGGKYYVFKDFAAGINLRFYDFSKADNMEFNVSYRFGL